MMTRQLQLELLEHYPIKDTICGLNEPSGLTLDHRGTRLYTVSDDSKLIFNLDLQGRIISDSTFLIEVSDLEGNTLTADNKSMRVVQEQSNSIIRFDIITKKEIQRIPLASLNNYGKIATYFEHKNKNKGLEGITANYTNGHIFVVKEGNPGLLIELDSECKTLINYCLLDEKHVFKHPRTKSKKLDFSGLSYDHFRETIGITSDKGECLFTFTGLNKKS